EKYRTFFREFGKVLKEGIHTDYTNQEKIKALAMYESMNGKPGELISLSDYVKAMPESQKDIYYITGDSRKAVEANPALEYFRGKGYDVLFMTDPIDEWVMQSMFQFEKKSFKPVSKGEIELEGAEKESVEKTIAEAKEKHGGLVSAIAGALGEKVKEVRFTARLTDSPCCLVTEEHGLSPHMERLFRAMNQDVPETKRILELNPAHPLIAAMQKIYDADAADPELGKYASLLFDQALLTEGSPIPDAQAFARNVAELMVRAAQN
ncbi:MAG: molecular chaperone HtpG, partial [Lentisphaeria bacterium]|nr:molecular chaperone HtpG [Lentisphaeria bacterium]